MNKLNSYFNFSHDCELPPNIGAGVKHPQRLSQYLLGFLALCRPARTLETPSLRLAPFGLAHVFYFSYLLQCIFADSFDLGVSPASNPLRAGGVLSSESTQVH